MIVALGSFVRCSKCAAVAKTAMARLGWHSGAGIWKVALLLPLSESMLSVVIAKRAWEEGSDVEEAIVDEA